MTLMIYLRQEFQGYRGIDGNITSHAEAHERRKD